jgi:hypothetical protein
VSRNDENGIMSGQKSAFSAKPSFYLWELFDMAHLYYKVYAETCTCTHVRICIQCACNSISNHISSSNKKL